ncbi:MAG TPA: DNA repair protein RadA [Alphaproteobacteria bacterium]|nr:DNA repair protein RadA [Alphaproteobacteria bacterium]
MTGKERTIYLCQNCGYQSAKWLGRCPECGQWSSFVEERLVTKSQRHSARAPREGLKPVAITQVSADEGERLATGIDELDRVLGGGLVPGMVVLVGGDPGIGKSTLLLQVAGQMSRAGHSVLYISGEESAKQTRLRADRVEALSERLLILPETSLERIVEHIEQIRPQLVIADSVQTLSSELLQSGAGSISQVRDVTAHMVDIAKTHGIATFLVGHVTKDGALAGPKVLEHMVDCVLYFEGEASHTFRILRAVKNRFGSVNEIGVFEMARDGLHEVRNPSQIFLNERAEYTSGSVVICTLEGTRPLLVEVQALASPSPLALPRRVATGFDVNRVALLIAILEKRLGLHLHGEDVYLNIAGGIRVTEPAADLGVAAAIASSFRDRPIAPSTVIMGEVGLGGEVRAIPYLEPRLREAEKLGFQHALIPDANRPVSIPPGHIQLHPVSSLAAAFDGLF